MKKILLFTSILFLILTPSIVKSQTITSITITTPIICNGDFATVKINIDQTVPATQLRCFVGYYVGSSFVATDTINVSGSVANIQLQSGDYYVRLVDMLNTSIVFDEWSSVLSITQPSNLLTIDSIVVSEITCRDLDDASIVINASGGQIPYSFSIDSGLFEQLNNTFLDQKPGTYIAFVEDSIGCVFSTTVIITNPDSLQIDTTIFTDVSCYGSCDGAVQAIIASGGTAPYTYSVHSFGPFSHTNYFNSYCPGTYTVEVFDVNNCGAQDIIIIEEPDELLVSITTSLWNSYQIQCNGDSSGTAELLISGGISPYNMLCINLAGDTISNTMTAVSVNNILGLEADTYTFLVTDANGCKFMESIVYNEPSSITHNFIATHVSCNGWSNGSLIDVVAGGVGTATSYSYLWNTGETTYTLSSIPVGTYIMTVVDDNSCTSTATYVINDVNALAITINPTATNNVSCYDYCDGEIAVLTNGGLPMIDILGNPIYTYTWDDTLSQSSAIAVGLCADNTTNSTIYTCIVTDVIGCSDTVTYSLTQANSLVVTAALASPISCNLGNDGALNALATGGNGGILFSWNNSPAFSVSSTNNGLSEGAYVVIARDINGCLDTTEIILNQPSALVLNSLEVNHVSCYGLNDGEIIIDVNGGTVIGIQQYNYVWSYGFSETVNISKASPLAPGVYAVTATDANGCIYGSEQIYISQPANPLTIVTDSTDETCILNDGTATAYILGGTSSYSIEWSNGSVGSNSISGLSSGFYTVEVEDANACYITSTTYVNGVHDIFLPGNLSVIDSMVCLGTSIDFDIENKPALNYEWENGSNQADRTVTPLQGINEYVLTITDPTCSIPYQVTATILAVPVPALPISDPVGIAGAFPVILEGEQINIYSNNNSCSAYQWSWSEDTLAQQEISVNPTKSGWYKIAVEDGICLGYDSIYVVVGVQPYDAISPNNDGYNDTWGILDVVSYPKAIVQVFNRWGALVFETSGGLNYQPWDGTKNGLDLPVGTYYYIVDLNTGDTPQSGPITIIR
jgi:gliding motility-associated-like protein